MKLKPTKWCSYCRNCLSPAAPRMSCISSLVAAIARFAASMWRCLWLDVSLSLLIPPVGSLLRVASKESPWLHFPVYHKTQTNYKIFIKPPKTH